ncbi:AAEL004901-PA [Aedes aegypti]|uniref:AAEL004901-PA n=1 Tax=Aedes aegypti TaxID=7159 RepID=Q17BP8_AEDAE|nr:AAEL004901-PA [Aedes aegypti]
MGCDGGKQINSTIWTEPKEPYWKQNNTEKNLKIKKTTTGHLKLSFKDHKH